MSAWFVNLIGTIGDSFLVDFLDWSLQEFFDAHVEMGWDIMCFVGGYIGMGCGA